MTEQNFPLLSEKELERLRASNEPNLVLSGPSQRDKRLKQLRTAQNSAKAA